MLCQSARVFPSPVVQVADPGGIIKIAAARPPTNIRQQVKPGLMSKIGNPIWRRSVQADSIHSGLTHGRKIFVNLRAAGERFAVRVCPERAIRHSFDPETLPAHC